MDRRSFMQLLLGIAASPVVLGLGPSGTRSGPDFSPRQRQDLQLIAVGGGACMALNTFLARFGYWVPTVAINTDARGHDRSHAGTRLLVGWQVVRGRGARGDLTVGRAALRENAGDVGNILRRSRTNIILAGLGAGTGGGAGALLARWNGALGNRGFGIVTVPFGFEGEARRRSAELTLVEFRSHTDGLSVLSLQDFLRTLPRNVSLRGAFHSVDRWMSEVCSKVLMEAT